MHSNSTLAGSSFGSWGTSRPAKEHNIMTITSEQISYELLSWLGVIVQPHRFGGLEFRLNGHELGHLHGNRQAISPFSVKIREELVAAGKASLYTIFCQRQGG
jgi:Family of unknown function (DUF5519)